MSGHVLLTLADPLMPYSRRGHTAQLEHRIVSMVLDFVADLGTMDIAGEPSEELAQFYFDLLDVTQEFAEPGTDLAEVLNSCSPVFATNCVNSLHVLLHFWDTESAYYEAQSDFLHSGIKRIN